MIIIVICNLILMHNYAGGWGEGRVVAHGHTIGGGGRSPRAHFTAANLTSSACGDLLAIPSLYAPWCRAHASPALNWKRMRGGAASIGRKTIRLCPLPQWRKRPCLRKYQKKGNSAHFLSNYEHALLLVIFFFFHLFDCSFDWSARIRFRKEGGLIHCMSVWLHLDYSNTVIIISCF